MNKKRLWTRGAAWLLALCLLAGLCVPTVRAEGETNQEDESNENVLNEAINPSLENNGVVPCASEQKTYDIGLSDIQASGTAAAGHASVLFGAAKGDGVAEINPNPATSAIGVELKTAYAAIRKLKDYKKSTAQLEFKNVSKGAFHIEFKWESTSAYGTISVKKNGTPLSSAVQGSYEGDNKVELQPNEVITFDFASSEDDNGRDRGLACKVTILRIIYPEKPVSFNFYPAEDPGQGYYTVGKTQTDIDATVKDEVYHLEQSSDIEVWVKAVPNSGYIFQTWQDTDTGEFLSGANPYQLPTKEGCNIRPVFAKEGTALFRVGAPVFATLTEANAYAGKEGHSSIIVLKCSGTLADTADVVTISKGNTLNIPCSADEVLHTTEPAISKSEPKRSVYRSLTVRPNMKIVVEGGISVDSLVLYGSSGNISRPVGPYGTIQLGQDASIELKSGANLYCWGYITGAGTVIANDGSRVYECFQMASWRGGTAGLTMALTNKRKRVFVLTQYYVQNIESTVQFFSGARDTVYYAFEASGTLYTGVIEFVGTSATSSLFQLQNGYITRKYEGKEDRIVYAVHGDFTISEMDMTVGPVPMKTSDFVLPLTSSMTIRIEEGKTTVNNAGGVSFLPGTKFYIAKNATMSVECTMYIMDRESWVNKHYAAAGVDLVTVAYSPTKEAKRDNSEKYLPDAEIDVDGVLIVAKNGQIYTTATESEADLNGANIHSTNGTGRVLYQVAAASKNTSFNQVTQSGTNVTYVTVTVSPAKLKNGGTGEGAKPYTETSGAPAGAVYYYDVDEFGNGSKNWYRFNVTYVINGTSDTKQLNTETKLSDVTIDGAIESVTATVTNADGKPEQLKDATGKVIDKSYVTPEDKALDISKILTAVQEYDAKNGYKNMGNVTISITTNNKGSSHPMFVLSAKQLRIYQSFGGTATFTELTDKPGYYLVKDITDPEKRIGGTPCTADDVNMPVPDYDKFGWYMGEGSDAQEFGNVVPGLDGRIVYIYGRYSGYAVEMDYPVLTHPSNYYTTIAEAMSYVTDVGNITYTLKMLADNDAFADDGGKYTIPVNRDITLDLNGFTVTGTITNNGTLTIQDSTHSETNDGTGKVTSASNNTITNAGTLTLESGKFVSTGGATAVKNNGTLNVGTGAAFKGKNAASSSVISGKANYPDSYQLSTSLVDGYFRVVEAKVTITWKNWDGTLLGTSIVNQGQKPEYPTELPTPTKPADNNYKYEFKGWSPALGPATSATTYTAQYTAIPKKVHLTGSTEDYFETLQDAINAAEAGDTLILLKDVSGSAVFDKNLTLDLNEQTSSGNITVNNGVTLTIKGTGTISASGTAVLNKGKLILLTGITVKATGNNGIALDNSGTIDSITGGEFTGHVAVQVDGTGSITKISGGDFISSGNGGHAVNVGANGTIGTISGGTFKADMNSHVLVNKNTSNPIKLEGTARFGGVSLRSGVMESESSFTFNDGYTLSTKADEHGYFTIVQNTFTLVFDVDGKRTTKTGVSRSGDVDLSSLCGADPEKTGYQFNGWTYNGTNIGKGTVKQADLGTPGTGETVTVYATWNVVYSVTITWGSLEYDYKGATYVWDGQNMKYKVDKEAHWESVDTNNTVKVTNNTVAEEGTVQVKAKYEKTGDYMFDLLLPNKTSLTTEQKQLGEVAPKGGIQSWSFLLDGAPSGNAFTKATVGKITLTLQPVT